MSENPHISVCIPNYNDAGRLTQALAAVLAQDIEDIEIIICDDASTDYSWDLIQQLAQSDRRIKIFRHSKNLGVVVTLLDCYENCRGKYIYSGSSNDYLLPGFFTKGLKILEEHKDLSFFAGLCLLEYPDGQKQKSDLGWGSQARRFLPHDLQSYVSNGRAAFHGQATLFRASHLPKRNELNVELKGNFDLFYYFVMAFRHGFYYSPEVYARVTMEADSFSSKDKGWQQKTDKIMAYLENLEKPCYTDIRRSFIRSGKLSFLGFVLGWVILRRFQWRYLSVNLVANLMRLFVKKIKF
jgi:glycosyltransferase involved in cell wall biosynthesis